jgi:hypothetical protein
MDEGKRKKLIFHSSSFRNEKQFPFHPSSGNEIHLPSFPPVSATTTMMNEVFARCLGNEYAQLRHSFLFT